MATDLQNLALKTVWSATPFERENVPLLVKRLRDADPDREPMLGVYIEAVKWALNHPTAGDLPTGSVVASAGTAYIKGGDDFWSDTNSWDNPSSDYEITLKLAADEAAVLRVGTGA